MLESELIIDVLESFDLLSKQILKLCDAIISESHLLAWVQDTDYFSIQTLNHSRNNASLAFNQLFYQDNQAPREIIIVPGFVGASDPTIKLAREVNECKDCFKKNVLALKTRKKALKTAGLARLHLKQCYRKIPILASAPTKISWTWAHTRSIKKINVKSAQELLLKKGDDWGIKLQLEKLNHLSPNEPLAIVQELAPHLRANIVFNEDQRCMIKGPLPILFPCQENTPLPHFKVPKKKSEKDVNRHVRSDARLDPVPFLPAIRVHRYTTLT